MFQKIKFAIAIAFIGFLGYTFFLGGSSKEQTADLGQVADRTEFALSRYQDFMKNNSIAEVSDERLEEFRTFYVSVLNRETRFFDKTLGVEIREDSSFLGFADTNANDVKDAGEKDVFTVELDSENNRMIVTDVAGNSTGLRFSGAGFIAGALIGSMLSKQRAAGIAPGQFNNRNVTDRSAYRAPASARSGARSGGLRAGK